MRAKETCGHIVLLNACIAIWACGPDGPEGQILAEPADGMVQDAIINGTTAPAAERTGAVFLPNSGCSGHLLRPEWVLTAAHCPVAVGHSIELGGKRSSVKAISIHPDWVSADCLPQGSLSCPALSTRAGDALMLLLDTPLYPTRPDGTTWEFYERNMYDGTSVSISETVVYGYGYSVVNGTCPNETLSGSGTQLQAFDSVDRVEDLMIVFDGNSAGQFATRGDSGASFLVSSDPALTIQQAAAAGALEVAGVHSFGNPCDPAAAATAADSLKTFVNGELAKTAHRFNAPSLIVAAVL